MILSFHLFPTFLPPLSSLLSLPPFSPPFFRFTRSLAHSLARSLPPSLFYHSYIHIPIHRPTHLFPLLILQLTISVHLSNPYNLPILLYDTIRLFNITVTLIGWMKKEVMGHMWQVTSLFLFKPHLSKPHLFKLLLSSHSYCNTATHISIATQKNSHIHHHSNRLSGWITVCRTILLSPCCIYHYLISSSTTN